MNSDPMGFAPAEMGAETVGSSASSLSALAEAVALLDAQLGAIRYPVVADPNLAEMVAALERMQEAAGQWPPARAVVTAAAQQAVPLGELTGRLDVTSGTGAPDPDALAAGVSELVAGPLHDVVQSFAAAEDALNAFDHTMTDAYVAGSTANTAADAYVRDKQRELQNAVDHLRAGIDDLQSASGIAATVFTAGIYGAVELVKLQDELDAVKEQMQRWDELQRDYAAVLGAWSQALEMTRQSAYAVDTLNATLQQLANAARDINPITSPNRTVMQAVVHALQTECQALAAAARELASLGG